jgi:hypothetical protein
MVSGGMLVLDRNSPLNVVSGPGERPVPEDTVSAADDREMAAAPPGGAPALRDGARDRARASLSPIALRGSSSAMSPGAALGALCPGRLRARVATFSGGAASTVRTIGVDPPDPDAPDRPAGWQARHIDIAAAITTEIREQYVDTGC